MFDPEVLRKQVEAGATLAALAQDYGVDRTVVRRELARAGLRTARQRVLATSEAARALGATSIMLACATHGEVMHRRDARGSYRCPHCNAMRVAAHRRAVKDKLVDEAGGACRTCGYDRCSRALSFHHVDPSNKSFGLAMAGIARSLEKARAEAAKCMLLWANCHMEVETGLREIPLG